jgi:hypothetical protein
LVVRIAIAYSVVVAAVVIVACSHLGLLVKDLEAWCYCSFLQSDQGIIGFRAFVSQVGPFN